MQDSAYPDRDYRFGQQILLLRTGCGLTQSGLAELLGVSRRAIVGWEVGNSYPSSQHLKDLIELCLQRRAFHRGQEGEEIRVLWKDARLRVPLDETWLTRLLEASQDTSASPTMGQPSPSSVAESQATGPRVDWGDSPEVPSFFGRESELTTLTDWLVKQRCRVVSVLGLGGIGKSALAVTLMHRVADQFEVVIWRSLRDAPPCESWLDELLRSLAGEPLTTELDSLERRLNLVFEYLRARRVLLVLDNLESVMEQAEERGRMLSSYEGYGRLLRRAAETKHKSCLLLTSREKPIEIAPLEGPRTSVRSMHLGQLDGEACGLLLQEKEINGSAADRDRLAERYGGNPLALKIVAPTIADLFGGEISAFLEQGELIFGSVRYLLQEQFARLSALEESVMLWLAILREAVTVSELSAVLVNPLPRGQILEALDNLRGRSLIEPGKSKGSFTLQSVVMEYATTRLVEGVGGEIEREHLDRLIDHGLELATVKEYVRQAQMRLVVVPILSRLRSASAEPAVLEARLIGLLEPLRGRTDGLQGYAPANLVTLLRTLRGDLSKLDLHQLSLREASLEGVNLQDANLAQSTLRDVRLTEAFDIVWSLVTSKKGTFWARGDRQGQVRVWSPGEQLLRLAWKAHFSVVSALAFSPDEQRLVTGSWDGLIKMWEVANGALLWTSPPFEAIFGLDFSPDGRVLASGGTDGHIRLWETTRGTLLQTLADHKGPVLQVAWSPNGNLLASAGDDAIVRLWEVTKDASSPLKPAPLRRLVGHGETVTGLTFSADGQTLATASEERTVKFWDVRSGTLKETIPVQSRPWSLAWTQDGRYLASGELDRAFWVWDVEQHKPRTAFFGKMGPARAVAFTPDSGTLITANEDGGVQTWDLRSGQCTRSWLDFARTIHDLAWSPNSAQIASGGSDRFITIWDVASRSPRQLLRGHKMMVWGISWSPDGRLVASCGEDGTVRIWDAAAGSNAGVLTDPVLANNFLFTTAWSPDGSRLAVGSYQRGVLVYDIHAQALQPLGPSNGPDRIRRVEWSPDGRYLAASSEGEFVYVWNADSYSLLASLQRHRGMVAALAWSPDGTRLASGSWGHRSDQLFIWDAGSWDRLLVLDDPSESVYGVAWSADSERLVSAGSDGILRWWNPRDGRCVMSRPGHQGSVQSLRASPDGRLLASCGDDGAIRIWQMESGESVAMLRRDRPYERLDITGIKGITDAQKQTLKMMGAVERESNND